MRQSYPAQSLLEKEIAAETVTSRSGRPLHYVVALYSTSGQEEVIHVELN
jgi:hypothetical protein